MESTRHLLQTQALHFSFRRRLPIMFSRRQSIKLARPNRRTIHFVENHADLQLIGSIEAEYRIISDMEQQVVLQVEGVSPCIANGDTNDDDIAEERHNRLDEATEALEGVEVSAGFFERLTFALMDGCASCHCAPFKSSMRTTEEPCQTAFNRRSVGFGCIEIHEFYMTLGDHPSAVSGPPVSLDYSQEITKKYSLDEYENSREPRRKRRHLKLSYKDRRDILEKHRGFSTDEVNQAWLEGFKIRQQREETLKQSLVMNMWDEVTESTQRKIYRFVEAVGLA